MISRECNINEFINFVKDKDRGEIIFLCREYKKAEKLLHSSKKDGKYVIQNYRDVIRGLAWLLQYGSKPATVSDQDFELYRPIIENLVKKEQMNPEVLELFK